MGVIAGIAGKGVFMPQEVINTAGPNTFVPSTLFGEVITQPLKIQTAITGRYGVNTKIVTATTANGGTVTTDNSRFKLSTGVNVAGLARIESYLPLIYVPGIAGHELFTAVFATPKADNRQLFGLSNGLDRICIGYNGLDFVAGKKRGSGAYEFTTIANFNGEWPNSQLTRGTIDFTKGNIYKIAFQWLGYGPIVFSIKDPTRHDAGWKEFHAIEYANTDPLPHTLNPTFKLFAEVENVAITGGTGNNTNVIAYTPSMYGGLEGDPGGEWFNPLHLHGVLNHSAAFSDTNNNHLITIRNKSLFPSTDTNITPMLIHKIKMNRTSTGASTVSVRIYKNATTAIALAGWTNYDATNSPAEYSTTTTTVTGGTVIGYATMTDTDTSDVIDFEGRDAYMNPGESITVAITDNQVAATTSIATINFVDLL
jgi:hypothetical protein